MNEGMNMSEHYYTAAPASERQSPEQAEHRLPRTEPDEFFD